MSNQQNDNGLNIDELASSIDFESLYEEDVERKQVNFWIKNIKQESFLAIQKRTRYKFGKEICRLIEKCVEMAEAADPHRQDKGA